MFLISLCLDMLIDTKADKVREKAVKGGDGERGDVRCAVDGVCQCLAVPLLRCDANRRMGGSGARAHKL